MTILLALALLLPRALCAESKAVPPKDSHWRCGRPGVKAVRKGGTPPNPPEEAAGPRWYGTELRCLVEWLSDFSEGGKFAKDADPSVYDGEKRRAELVLEKVSAFLGSAHRVGAKVSSEEAKGRSRQHYLSGVIYFQKGDYEKARAEWKLAKEIDPTNADAAAGLERIDKLYLGPDPAR